MKKDNKVKILYIGPVPPEVGGQRYGGVAIHLWELATYARKNGYDVYILANTTSSFIKYGIKVIGSHCNKLSKAFKAVKFRLTLDKGRTGFLKFLSFKERLGILYIAYYLKQVLETIKPDLIHVHSLLNHYNLALKILQPYIPIVITDHESYYWATRSEKDLIRVRIALSITSSVICVSLHVKERLEQLMLSNLNYKPKLHVIHNPIDVSKMPLLNREELRKKWGEKRIVFFSGVTEPIRKKRLDLLLKAFTISNYLKNNCKLIILTGGEGVRYAKEYISQYKIDGVVLSRRPWNEVVEYYTVADVFVMPSVSEGFGLVYVEALLAGTPVVGYYETIKELEELLDIYIGEGFDPSREGEKELAEKIEKVLKMKFDRELLRRRVIEVLSWDRKFAEFDAVYKEVLKR